MCRHYAEFNDEMKSIDPKLYYGFEKILDEQSEFLTFENAGSFVERFRLSARIMIEIFKKGL